MGKRMVKRAIIVSSTSLWLAAGCGAAGGDDDPGVTVRPGDPEPGDTETSTDRTPSQPNTPTTSTNGPDFNVSEDTDDGLTPMGCQQAQREFVPSIPTVYLLVDRSGTMFDAIPGVDVDGDGQDDSAWDALRGGVLQVIRELEGNIRFGFAAFSGANGGVQAGVQQCDLLIPSVAPTLSNFQGVASVYESLAEPENSKETPTVLALNEVAAQLRSDPAPGDKFILFVTDGEPDYCNDSNAICPPDSVVGLLQKLAAGVDSTGVAQAPIKTMVFGVSSPTASIRQDVLQALANAGAGVPVLPPSQNANQPPDMNAFYDQCAGEPGWAVDFAATGKPAVRGQTVGDYVTDPALAGSAPIYRPDPTDQAALAEQFRTALSGVKSCEFDLGEDGVQVDLSRQDLGDQARVLINGAPVPFDAANGWGMGSETTVVLAGAACEAWREPTVATTISFDFPCDVFVPR